MQAQPQPELPWWFFPGIGLSSAVCAVWAVETIACGGLLAGALATLITTAGRVEEYDALGRVTWRVEKGAGYVFRAQRITSLYAPGTGMAR